MNKDKILGMILSGGLSRRMGSDKTFKKISGVNLIQHTIKRSTKQVGRLIVNSNDSNKIFIHRGIATRQFQRNFILAEGIEVEEASMDNGLLFIDLSQPISNEESKKIEIKDKNNKIKDNLISVGNK